MLNGFPSQMADIYDSSRGLVKIGPCTWSPNLDIAFWLSQNDDTILKVKAAGRDYPLNDKVDVLISSCCSRYLPVLSLYRFGV